MLFDILVIGILILSLNKLAEKRIENKRYLDEIDDFRGWKSEEAAYRIAGSIKRLKRNGFKGEINLRNCYLSPADLTQENLLDYISPYLSGINLEKADLRRANLRGADLREANLMGASLYRADLRGADLKGANLKGANLHRATLRGANFHKADLHRASLEGTDLVGVKYLEIYQLLIVKTLYEAELDLEIMEQVKAKCPHFLKKPE